MRSAPPSSSQRRRNRTGGGRASHRAAVSPGGAPEKDQLSRPIQQQQRSVSRSRARLAKQKTGSVTAVSGSESASGTWVKHAGPPASRSCAEATGVLPVFFLVGGL